jgi:hypothetical protein
VEIEPIKSCLHDEMDVVRSDLQKIDQRLLLSSTHSHTGSSPHSPTLLGTSIDGSAAWVSVQDLEKLVHLGFAEHDCLLALEATSGNVDDAAAWLFENAPRVLSHDHDRHLTRSSTSTHERGSLHAQRTRLSSSADLSEGPLGKFKNL